MADKIKTFCLVIFLACLNGSLYAQSVSAGFGVFNSNQETFRQGKKINLQLAFRLTPQIMPALSLSYGFSPTESFVHSRLIRYNGYFSSGPIDTLYDVQENNAYNFINILFKVRFLIPVENSNRFRFTMAPVIGFTGMSEAKSYQHPSYNRMVKSSTLCMTFGVNAGIEYALDKKKRLILEGHFEPLIIKSENFIYDAYMPPFSRENTFMTAVSLNLRWEFGSANLL